MCGIGGVWNRDGRPFGPSELAGMAKMLAPRGPDGSGVHTDGALGLVHTRLAILDPTPASAQPMPSPDGRFWIVFNGEIYNFLELRQELQALGHVFTTNGDTEVILAAYAAWKEDCQLRFNGMWAFAIWDSRERRLFLSRDRFGVKPLHYLWNGERFAFASETKGFLALEGFSGRFDSGIVARSLIDFNQIEGTEDGIFAGTRRLKGGYCMMVEAQGPPRLRRWWNTLDYLEEPPAAEKDRIARVRELFMDACRLRLRSDVPIATALSGGLDSSSVHVTLDHLWRTGRAGAHCSHVHWRGAVSASFPGSAHDERPYAEAVIDSTGGHGMILSVDADAGLRHLDEVLFSFEEICDMPSPAWQVYREMRRLGCKISVDGHGADELFAGYHHYYWHGIHEGPVSVPAEELQGTLDAMTVPAIHRAPPGSWPDRSGFLRVQPTPAHFPGQKDDAMRIAHWDVMTRTMYRDVHYLTLPTILRNFDRCSMANGVEIRTPFLDWRLVCLAFSLPLTDKARDHRSKWILRQALADLLPASVRDRPTKMGFVSPLADWMLGGLKGFMLDTVSSRDFLDSPIWNGPAIRDVVVGAAESGNGHLMRWAWEFVAASRLEGLFRDAKTNV